MATCTGQRSISLASQYLIIGKFNQPKVENMHDMVMNSDHVIGVNRLDLSLHNRNSSFMKVTVHLTRSLQLCDANSSQTDCCLQPLCVVESVQVTACLGGAVVAVLLVQAEIFALSSSNMVISGNATVIPNQVYQPLGSCPCNLTAGACDIRCCCDQDCNSNLKLLFSAYCYAGVFGGNVTPLFDQLCSAQNASTVTITPTERLVTDLTGFVSNPSSVTLLNPAQQPVPSVAPSPIWLTRMFSAAFLRGNPVALPKSGNPGYQIGKPVIAGNLQSGTGKINRTTLNLWEPVGNGLCSNAKTTAVLFRQDSITGCLLQLSQQNFTNCTYLRDSVQNTLSALVPATLVAKMGNSDSTNLSQWLHITSLPSNVTLAPADDLPGSCSAVPSQLNIHIFIADTGAVEGAIQQEIINVETGFTPVLWQLQCGGASIATCLNDTIVQTFPVSISVTFIKIDTTALFPKTRCTFSQRIKKPPILSGTLSLGDAGDDGQSAAILASGAKQVADQEADCEGVVFSRGDGELEKRIWSVM
ncbi:TECT2 protein, partial [Polypterus senegalus]